MSLGELAPYLAEKAKLELNEDPRTRLHKIEELREKLKARPDLPFETTDRDLIRFLRARKFDVDSSFNLIVMHYETKRDNNEIFTNFNPTAEKKTYESGFNIAFPDRDQNGCKILAFSPGSWDPSQRTLINNFRANIMAMEVVIQDEETQINGVVVIVDFRSFGLTQAKALNFSLFRTYGTIILNCYPVRIKGIHILDQPAIFTVIFSVLSTFMKDKVKKRVKLHGSNIEGIREYIDKEILPSNYGGLNAATEMRIWVKTMMNAEEELEHIWT